MQEINICIPLPPTETQTRGANIIIQDLFDKWFDEERKDVTYLFRDLIRRHKDGSMKGKDHSRKILWPWVIKLGSETSEGEEGMNARTSCKGKDAIQDFMTAFNNQMGHLTVALKVPPDYTSTDISQEQKQKQKSQKEMEIRVQLFAPTNYGCFQPVRDSAFKEAVNDKVCEYRILGSNVETLHKQIVEKAKRFYRAIGRIFLHIICNCNEKEKRGAGDSNRNSNTCSISTRLLPKMLRSVLLQGVEPGYSISYLREGLLDDIDR